MELPRIGRTYVYLSASATLAGGGPADITGLDVAAVPYNGAPDGDTPWTAAEAVPDSDDYRILAAGPDADPAGALPITDDADLWVRVVDSPEVDTRRATRIFLV